MSLWRFCWMLYILNTEKPCSYVRVTMFPSRSKSCTNSVSIGNVTGLARMHSIPPALPPTTLFDLQRRWGDLHPVYSCSAWKVFRRCCFFFLVVLLFVLLFHLLHHFHSSSEIKEINVCVPREHFCADLSSSGMFEDRIKKVFNTQWKACE